MKIAIKSNKQQWNRLAEIIGIRSEALVKYSHTYVVILNNSVLAKPKENKTVHSSILTAIKLNFVIYGNVFQSNSYTSYI